MKISYKIHHIHEDYNKTEKNLKITFIIKHILLTNTIL